MTECPLCGEEMAGTHTAFCAPCWNSNPDQEQIQEHGTPGVELEGEPAEPQPNQNNGGTRQEGLDAFA